MKRPKKEILVTYSSGYGATREVAEEIARVLENIDGFKVDSKNVNDCEVIKNYDALIIGSSVRADKPLANARDFFAQHRYDLVDKKLALFVVSITASTPLVPSASLTKLSTIFEHSPFIDPEGRFIPFAS